MQDKTKLYNYTTAIQRDKEQTNYYYYKTSKYMQEYVNTNQKY